MDIWLSRAIPRRGVQTLLFQKFFETISRLLPERALIGNPEALADLNPNKIYLENIRSVLGVSSRSAQRICDTAVRQGVFRKYVEVVRPDGAGVVAAESENELPEFVRYWKEEGGNYEELSIPTREHSKTVFYRLNDEEASREPHTQPT
jgi:hypothetical protein